jgi:1,4-dihydroxy-2-naphthoate polyprenyltransferase
MVAGTHWVMARQPSIASLYVSIPIGLMVASILFYQSLPDMRTDRLTGKNTLALKLGRRGSVAGLLLFFLLTYVSIIVLVVGDYLSWIALGCLVSVPLAVRIIRLLRRTDDWVFLDRYGKYVRIFYFVNGCAIIGGLF